MTAYENITGHRVKHPVVMFGETLNFKLKQDESRTRKVESDLSKGIFVGVDPRTSEALVISRDALFQMQGSAPSHQGGSIQQEIVRWGSDASMSMSRRQPRHLSKTSELTDMQSKDTPQSRHTREEL